jgi:hypothetical protein
LFRPADALADGRLGDQVRARDFRGGESADRPERQGYLRGGRERGMAAQQQQRQSVVLGGRIAVGWLQQGCGQLTSPAGCVAAHHLDQPAGRDRD